MNRLPKYVATDKLLLIYVNDISNKFLWFQVMFVKTLLLLFGLSGFTVYGILGSIYHQIFSWFFIADDAIKTNDVF